MSEHCENGEANGYYEVIIGLFKGPISTLRPLLPPVLKLTTPSQT